MTKEVRVIAWCENHPDVAASSEVTASVGVGRFADPRVVDVCDDCINTIVGPFIDLMEKGVPPGPPEPTVLPREGRVTCPLCPVTLTNRQGLSGHLRTKHDTGLRQLQAEGIVV